MRFILISIMWITIEVSGFTQAANFRQVQSSEFNDLISNFPGILLDVRTKSEFLNVFDAAHRKPLLFVIYCAVRVIMQVIHKGTMHLLY